MADDSTYPPLNTLKAVAPDIWIVDGPGIRFGPAFAKMTFPTRMTVIRLGGSALFIHSPTALPSSLRDEIAGIGVPRWIVGPNRIHYWWLPDWKRSYPDARIYLAPLIRAQAGRHIDFAAEDLVDAGGYPWDDRIATLAVAGSYMTEFEFFHHASRTLVLTDLIENFEAHKLGRLERWLTRLGGVQDPDGKMPLDIRLTFLPRRAALRQAIETMIAWGPERVILAHGRWYPSDGVAELRRAFRWLLRAS
jgi:hypothetical protein